MVNIHYMWQQQYQKPTKGIGRWKNISWEPENLDSLRDHPHDFSQVTSFF